MHASRTKEPPLCPTGSIAPYVRVLGLAEVIKTISRIRHWPDTKDTEPGEIVKNFSQIQRLLLQKRYRLQAVWGNISYPVSLSDVVYHRDEVLAAIGDIPEVTRRDIIRGVEEKEEK